MGKVNNLTSFCSSANSIVRVLIALWASSIWNFKMRLSWSSLFFSSWISKLLVRIRGNQSRCFCCNQRQIFSKWIEIEFIDKPQSFHEHNSPDRYIPLDLSHEWEPWNTHNSTCCALCECDLRMSHVYYRTIFDPSLEDRTNVKWRVRWKDMLPQIKQVFRSISSFLCFSVRRSAKLSIITPKIKFKVMIITIKKNIISYITRKKYNGSLKDRQSLMTSYEEEEILLDSMVVSRHRQYLRHFSNLYSMLWQYTWIMYHKLVRLVHQLFRRIDWSMFDSNNCLSYNKHFQSRLEWSKLKAKEETKISMFLDTLTNDQETEQQWRQIDIRVNVIVDRYRADNFFFVWICARKSSRKTMKPKTENR